MVRSVGRAMLMLVVLLGMVLPRVATPFENTMAERTRACTACHGAQGRAGPDGYYPRLAGKPAGYLYNQLVNIREGRRHYALMAGLIESLDDNYLKDMAHYFSELELPYPVPRHSVLSPSILQRGHALVTSGDPGKGIPPCQQCHGKALTGAEPHVPGLLGLPRDYLNAQLGGWRTGQRRAQAPDCMAHIASRLTSQDIVAVTGWLADQTLPSDTRPLAKVPEWPPGTQELRCGSAQVKDHINARVEVDQGPAQATSKQPTSTSQQVRLGSYLAQLGNCAVCHTAAGATPYAGQRPIETPFGTIYTPNLTPDKRTGLGLWTRDDFWQAMHQGRSRGGRLLSPAFPYTSFTLMTRADSDALFAYLQTLAPVLQPNRPHAMRWPFGTQIALWGWQSLFFKPQVFAQRPDQTQAWNRGAYLVNGLGHCNQCHTPRNALGALQDDQAFTGAVLPGINWLAPSLVNPDEAGTNTRYQAHTLALLRTGMTPLGIANGPMAQVVQGSTQYLSPSDLQAVGTYLQSLVKSQATATPRNRDQPAMPQSRSKASSQAHAEAAALYERHCATCHGMSGEGMPGAYPALRESRSVLATDSRNLIQSVLHGGYGPVTRTTPKPFGMPPFVLTLNDRELALTLTFVRQSWGNNAPEVTAQHVNRLRDKQAR